MYKLDDGLPHYVRIYKQDLALKQTISSSAASLGNLGSIEVDGINGSLEAIVRTHGDLDLDPGKIITVVLQDSSDSTTWNKIGEIAYKEGQRTITKKGETTLWQRRLPPVYHFTRMQVTTDADFEGQIQAWYDNDYGNIVHRRNLGKKGSFYGDEEHFVNNINGSVSVTLTVLGYDLSVPGDGKIAMALESKAAEKDSWVSWITKDYTLNAPDKIEAGTELGRFSIPSTVKRYLRAQMSTDDAHLTGTVDVLLAYLPR